LISGKIFCVMKEHGFLMAMKGIVASFVLCVLSGEFPAI